MMVCIRVSFCWCLFMRKVSCLGLVKCSVSVCIVFSLCCCISMFCGCSV